MRGRRRWPRRLVFDICDVSAVSELPFVLFRLIIGMVGPFAALWAMFKSLYVVSISLMALFIFLAKTRSVSTLPAASIARKRKLRPCGASFAPPVGSREIAPASCCLT